MFPLTLQMPVAAKLTVSGEVKNPTRTVPLALLFGLGAVAVLYMSVQLVAQGVLGPRLALSQDNPLAESAGRFLGPGGVTLITVGLVVSSLGLVSGDMGRSFHYDRPVAEIPCQIRQKP